MKKIALFILFMSFAFSQFTEITQMEHDSGLSLYVVANTIGTGTDEHVIISYYAAATPRMKTFSVNQSTYVVTETETYAFGTATTSRADFFVIDSTHVIIATEDSGNDGWVKTLSVSTDKATIAEIDAFEHNGTKGLSHEIEQIDATHYLIMYSDTDEDVWAKVIIIDGSYNISMGDSIEILDATTMQLNSNSLRRRGAEDEYVFSYVGTTDTYIGTISVDVSYNLTLEDNIVTSIIGSYGSLSEIEMIDDTHVLLSAVGDGVSILETFSIHGTTFDLTQTDSLYTGALTAHATALLKWDALGNFIWSWADGDSDGQWRGYTINLSTYAITAVDNQVEYDPTTIGMIDMARYNTTHFLTAYPSATGDGQISVATYVPPSTGWAHTINGVASPTSVSGVEPPTSVSGVE